MELSDLSPVTMTLNTTEYVVKKLKSKQLSTVSQFKNLIQMLRL